MKHLYLSPDIEIFEMLLEQPIMSGSSEDDGDSPYLEPGEDF